MKKGIAMPERNTGKKMVMVVRTRSPLEAYNMLSAGMPVDQAIGWYQKQTDNVDVQDVYMMDLPQKLRYITDLKELVAIKKSDVEQMTKEAAEIIQLNKSKINEQSSRNDIKGEVSQ